MADRVGSRCPDCGHATGLHLTTNLDLPPEQTRMVPAPCMECQRDASTIPAQAVAAILEADAAETHTRTVEARLVRVRLALSQLLDDAELHPDAKENRR